MKIVPTLSPQLRPGPFSLCGKPETIWPPGNDIIMAPASVQ
jgi:hypothetical protein|tara:strand:- start:99 stop:221 length:123 start_codon:yes stop_codon:yes gene_type:complete